MNQKQKIILIVSISIFLLYMGYTLLFEQKEKEEVIEQPPLIEKVEEEKKDTYKVDIKGQVDKPGVYEVSNESRVIDVIQMAGGLKKDANTDFLNLSKKVEDGSVIWVYTTKEIEKLKEVKTVTEYIEKECHCPDVSNSACVTKPTNTNQNNSVSSNEKININKASLQELTKLNGIGEAKAKLIIEYRTKKKFETIEEIKKVSGIGDSAYEKIKNFITV